MCVHTRVVPTALSTPLTCGAGSVAVFSGWLPHRSARNKSVTPRCAIYLTYVQAEGKSRDTKDQIADGLYC
jgi:ectoine hydroxylase-related dioxygenase (phytanoyl-CoA dioxygenase family)